MELYQGKGCNNCYRSGYQGRKGIFEIMPISAAIRKMITDGSGDDVIRQQAIKEGMKTLHRSAVDEVLAGVTTIDEVMRVINLRTE